QLIKKYQEGLLSDDEKFLLEEWFSEIETTKINNKWSEDDKNRLKSRIIGKVEALEKNSYIYRFPEKAKIKKKTEMELQQAESHIFPLKNANNRRLWAKIAIAASVFILINISAWLFVDGSWKQSEQAIARIQNSNDILPGSNRAVLKLGNGNIIILDSIQNGLFAHQGQTKVVKEKEGLLVYHARSDRNNEKLNYNILATPRGGQYQVTLPDGSKAWLNAASSIRFPTAFQATERIVDITGEVYFEIAKAFSSSSSGNKKDNNNEVSVPFIVRVNDVEIKVLGTHFNVIAYNDETNIKTTLLEGAVLISKGNENKLLRPGQQAVIANKNKNIDVINDVNIEEIVAWKMDCFNLTMPIWKQLCLR
ncbi:MAG: FecR domain-containing protein, partial [Salinivirgaceae bacterium]|nr:FecR domain-containing protein [Salinivirgaceae bacterium]